MAHKRGDSDAVTHSATIIYTQVAGKLKDDAAFDVPRIQLKIS